VQANAGGAVPEPLQELPSRATVYVFGPIDSGKSTLCSALAQESRLLGQLAYLDCDPGQSTIGPPATVGLRLYPATSAEAAAAEAPADESSASGDGSPADESSASGEGSEYLRFIGSTSPVGHLLRMLCGVRRLADHARLHAERERAAGSSGASRLIVDSSGFVEGAVAIEFQYNLIECLRPEILVGLGESASVRRVLANFRRDRSVRTVPLPVPPAVREKSAEARQSYRKNRFATYFRQARRAYVRIDRIGLNGRVPDFRRRGTVTGRLCALAGEGHFVESLAIAQQYHADKNTLEILTPAESLGRVTALQFGSIFLRPDGEEQRA